MAETLHALVERVVPAARWFAGKGRPMTIGDVTVLPWTVGPRTPEGAPPEDADAPHGGDLVGVRPVLVEVIHDDVSPAVHHTYQLLVAVRAADAPPGGDDRGTYGTVSAPEVAGTDAPVLLGDAARDPEAMTAVLAAVASQSPASDSPDSGEVPADTTGARVRHHGVRPLPVEDLTPRIFGGEQSNTSVFFGQALVLKVFRRLEIGHNLDIVVHEALAQDADAAHDGAPDERAHVARLYGWTEASWPAGGTVVQADLMMVVERFRGAEDGWDLATAACAAGQDFTADAAALGVALREVHDGMARQLPRASAHGRDVAATMVRRLGEAVAAAPVLQPHADGLAALFSSLEGRELATQHVHGDFHLGQVLRTEDGWRIIDFEGEPLKTLAERSAPDSPWRDVAGFLRSFDYAAAATAGPDTDSAQWRDTATAQWRDTDTAQWRDACRAAFLDAYCRTSPTSEDMAILHAYEADKAVYEVVYEVRNRPDWVSIPLGAVAQLASPSPNSLGDVPAIRKES